MLVVACLPVLCLLISRWQARSFLGGRLDHFFAQSKWVHRLVVELPLVSPNHFHCVRVVWIDEERKPDVRGMRGTKRIRVVPPIPPIMVAGDCVGIEWGSANVRTVNGT